MENPENYQESTFRDRPSTFSYDGKRVWLFPKLPSGLIYNWRRILAYILLLFFYIAPYIRFRSEPIVFLNFLERKFIFFGNTFYPQDFHLLVLAIIALVVFIVLFTVIYGRIFCGWLCPQTIFMEFLYRPIEHLIDGSPAKQLKLNEEELGFIKAFKRILKHSIFISISFVTILTFVSYVIGTTKLFTIIAVWPSDNSGFLAGTLIFTGMHYFIYGWFREQVCTIVCPYGRLQGVMLDENTILVAYDYKRGEPRSKNKGSGKGDCINCSKCVEVCPTGIDIRNGTQLECINCTACIDACNSVMRKINKPTGLIRFASDKSISEGIKINFNARAISYSLVLISLLTLIFYLFNVRGDVETTIIREQGTMFQEYGETKYSNLYSIQIVNKTNRQVAVNLKPLNFAGEILILGDSLIVQKGEVARRNLLIVLEKSKLKSSNTRLEIGVFEAGNLADNVLTSFVGPNNLDN